MKQGPSELVSESGSGFEALRRGDAGSAHGLFERSARERPSDVAAWWGLAISCCKLGDIPGQLRAVDKVLALNPRHLQALMMKADHYAALGDGRSAESFYRAVVARAPATETLPPQLREAVRRAAALAAQYARSFEAQLHAAVSEAGFNERTSSRRFSQSLDMLFGRKQIFLQSPTSFYFPELPQRQFFERSEFPWLAAIEAQTDVIREELVGLLGDEHRFQPYIQGADNRPPGEFGRLRDSLDWSAFYLIRGGAPSPQAASCCPRTMAALAGVPLCEAAGRTPSVLFSLLRPGCRIPPHTGQINARLICHLPLIVPEGCGLRVGNETRAWVEGETLIFDDTIEHEAWNGSRQLRAVLLFEIWRPELSPDERNLVAALLSAVAGYDIQSGRQVAP